MRFENCTIYKEIDVAIMLAESLLQPESIMDEALTLKNDWKYDNIKTGKSVSDNLINIQRKPIKIFTYRPWNPFTKAIGYFDGKAIHINVRKLLFMTTVEIAENLLHEYSHYCSYTHGNNFKSEHKVKFSVPYFISSNVNNWIKK